MKTRSRSGRPLRSEIAKALSTLRSDPALLRMKLRQRWGQRNEAAPVKGDAPRARTASIDQDLAFVIGELSRRKVRHALLYGDGEFRASVIAAVPDVAFDWVSHRDQDLVSGAMLPGGVAFTGHEAVVVGGADVKTAYLNALRWMEQRGVALPALWVGQAFEYCGSTLPVPQEIEAADIYLFQHFADFFPIKDPLLVRVTATARGAQTERFLLMQPQRTVHFTLGELLPERAGPAVVEVRTTHPALTGNRHPRWRVWADLFWKTSFTSLHGAHDFGPDRVCESRMPLSECRLGTMVLTLPNYDRRLSGSDADVRWMWGAKKGSFARDGSLAVEEMTLPRTPDGDDSFPFWGYRYQGYGTSYWFAFEETKDNTQPSLCGNHEVTVAQVEHRPPLSSERRRHLEAFEEMGFLFWPHALPLLDPSSEIDLGFSFEWANPQIHEFVVALFDGDGKLVERRNITVPSKGYQYSDDLLGLIGATSGHERPTLALISPDWKAMDTDPQHMNVLGNLAVRNRLSGDRDITEFQSCWRNLGATIDGFPHWLNPAKGVIGRTSVVGHIRLKHDLRTGLLIVNGAGNLNHSARAMVKVRLHAPTGEGSAREVEVAPFTSRVVWMDELFDDLPEFLDEGFGACLINSADADVNCQIITTTAAGAVSLQHLWGY